MYYSSIEIMLPDESNTLNDFSDNIQKENYIWPLVKRNWGQMHAMHDNDACEFITINDGKVVVSYASENSEHY